jgi:uncharacterized membrane protein YbhN (UPF0104 family)
MNQLTNPRLRTAARWLVALVVIGALLSLLDVGAIGQRLRGTDVRLAIPAIVGLVLVHLVAAAAWRRLLRELSGVALAWPATVRRYYAAQALGMVTPANLGADAYRVMSGSDGATRAQLAQPVVVQRLASIVAIVLLGLAGALVLPIDGLGLFALGGAMVGAASAWLVLALVRPPSAEGWSGAIARRLGWNGDMAPSRARVRSAIRDGLGLGLVFHAMSLVLGLVLVRAVDPATADRSLVVLGALAVARLSLAVPISPNGIGVQEGVLVLLFVQLGLPADTAIAAALLNRLALLVTAAIGLLCLMAPNADRARPMAAHPSRRGAGG